MMAALRSSLASAFLPGYLPPLERMSFEDLVGLKERLNGTLSARVREAEEDRLDIPEWMLAKPVSAPAKTIERDDSLDHLGSILSPSQVRTFTDCQSKWWYKYGLQLPDFRNGALAIGIAMHEAIAQNSRQKIESKQDLSERHVLGLYEEAWEHQATTAVFREDEDADELGRTGAALVMAYMAEAAPSIQPAQVEVEVSGEIAGVAVRGRIDVIDDAGTTIDVKSAAKAPSGIQADYRFQVATYAKLHPGSNNKAKLITITKTKTVKLITQSFSVQPSDMLQLEKSYPLVQEAMRSGLYVPNRSSMLCSRRHCPYWRKCEEEHGGTIDES